MSFTARSLAAISAAIRGDMRRELPGTDATIWPNTLSVFAKVVAMANHMVELRLAWIYRQIFASTAETAQLERHAYELGLSRRPASRAIGGVVTTGTPLAIYPAGIAFLSGADLYRTSGEAQAGGDGTLQLRLFAETPGAAGNRAAGETLVLADAALYPTVGPEATVDAGTLGGGADSEDDEALRTRVLDRKRRPPQGGAVSDYEQMAMAVPGVVKAWAWSFANGPGTVGVWFLFTGRPNLIPTPADVQAVRDVIEARRMIRVSLAVSAPVPAPLDVTIVNLSADTATVRAAIAAALTAMLRERAKPGVAAEAFVLSRSWISEAISAAIGEDRHVLASPLDDIVYTGGRYPVLGTVTYA
jgi:uncharacterized phage protein gp47/JayE